MLEWAVSSAVICALFIGLRYLLRGRIGLRLQYALWGLVLLRLLLPVSFGSSRLSVMNALPAERAAVTAPPTAAFTPLMPAASAPPASAGPEADTASPPVLTAAPRREAQSAPEPAAPVPEAPKAAPDPERTLGILWLTGAGLSLLWLLGVNLHFALRLRRSRTVFAGAEDYPLPVYVTAAAETPCLFGLLHPAVYLPPAAAEDPALDHILTHELTHFRHGDHVWSLLRCLALALHWYDPLVWWAALLSRRDGELACDEGALRALGEGERREYGRTLIRMTCEKRSGLFRTATTMTGSGRGLRERIRLIARRPRTALLTMGAVVLLAALALGSTFTGAVKAVEYTNDWFIETAWPYAEAYGKAHDLDYDLERNPPAVFRLTDGRTVEVYFFGENGDPAVDVTFIRSGNGTWEVRAEPERTVGMGLLDFAQSIPIEAADTVPHDSVLFTAAAVLDRQIRDWNDGKAVGDGLSTAHVNRIIKARITGLTPMGAGTEGLTEGRDLYLLEYRLLPEDQEHIVLSPGMRTEIIDGQTWITEWGEDGQPCLLIGWKDRDEDPPRADQIHYPVKVTSWSLLGMTSTRELEEVYGTPEMLERYGSSCLAAAAELYAAWLEDTATRPWLTVSSGGRSVEPLIAMRWARTWLDSGWLAADGVPVTETLARYGTQYDRLTLTRDGGVSLAFSDAVSPGSPVLRVYDENLELRWMYWEEPEKVLEGLEPGVWWCSVGIVVNGAWVSQAEQYEQTGYDCLFRLVVPEQPASSLAAEETRRWMDELGSPGSFSVRASGSLEEIGAQWAEAYAARYTGLSAENPLCCSEAAVRYCTLAAESLLPDPKEMYFRVCLFLNARDAQGFRSVCVPGDTPPNVDIYWPLEDPGYEGWLRMDFYVRLQNAGEDRWRSVELDVKGGSEWGWLDWTAPARDVEYCMSCLLEGTVRMPEMALRVLPHVDWSSFGETYGEEGREALMAMLVQGCRSTGFTNDPEDQSYRDMYVMLAALNAEDTAFFPELCDILRLQEAADPERFARCLSLLGERGGRLLSRMGAAAPYSSPIRNTAVYTIRDAGDLGPQEAALQLAGLFLEDLKREDPARTFRLTEYEDLEVRLLPTLDMEAETAAIYGLREEEKGADRWIAEISLRWRYTGTVSPAGPSNGDRWLDTLYQGSAVGFLLTRREDGYTLQSRDARQLYEIDSGLVLLREVSGYTGKDWDRAAERGELQVLFDRVTEAAVGDRQAQRDMYVMAAALRSDGAYGEFLSEILHTQYSADRAAWAEALAAFSQGDAAMLRSLADAEGETR